MIKRDKKTGRFIADGNPNSFNTKWVRSGSVEVQISQSDIEEAYRAGFETARRVPKTFSFRECFEGFLKYGY